MRQLLVWYQAKFPLIATFVASILAAIIVNYIPYLNLNAGLYSTLILTAGLFVLVWSIKETLETDIQILSLMAGLAWLFNLVKLPYLSEIVGNLFYILLFYVTIKETKKLILKKKT